METKSCNINNTIFSIWKDENEAVRIENASAGQKITISHLYLVWLQNNLRKIISTPLTDFFSQKEKFETGFFRMAKFRSHSGYSLDLKSWPSSGGCLHLQIPALTQKEGWIKLNELLSSFSTTTLSPSLSHPTYLAPAAFRTYAEVTKANNPPKQIPPPSSPQTWVRKNEDILNLNLSSLIVVTRLFASYSWIEVKQTLENHLSSKVLINPFMDDKAVLKTTNQPDHSLHIGLWAQFGELILKLEKWSESKHSWPDVKLCYGGWISISNLPLQHWKRENFEKIGLALGGLVSISIQTLNLTDLSHALIQVNRNLCGFLPASIKFSGDDQSEMTLSFKPKHYPSSTPLIPPNLHIEDLSNRIDQQRIQSALLHNGFPPNSLLGGVGFPCPARDPDPPIFSASEQCPAVPSPLSPAPADHQSGEERRTVPLPALHPMANHQAPDSTDSCSKKPTFKSSNHPLVGPASVSMNSGAHNKCDPSFPLPTNINEDSSYPSHKSTIAASSPLIAPPLAPSVSQPTSPIATSYLSTQPLSPLPSDKIIGSPSMEASQPIHSLPINFQSLSQTYSVHSSLAEGPINSPHCEPEVSDPTLSYKVYARRRRKRSQSKPQPASLNVNLQAKNSPPQIHPPTRSAVTFLHRKYSIPRPTLKDSSDSDSDSLLSISSFNSVLSPSDYESEHNDDMIPLNSLFDEDPHSTSETCGIITNIGSTPSRHQIPDKFANLLDLCGLKLRILSPLH